MSVVIVFIFIFICVKPVARIIFLQLLQWRNHQCSSFARQNKHFFFFLEIILLWKTKANCTALNSVKYYYYVLLVVAGGWVKWSFESLFTGIIFWIVLQINNWGERKCSSTVKAFSEFNELIFLFQFQIPRELEKFFSKNSSWYSFSALKKVKEVSLWKKWNVWKYLGEADSNKWVITKFQTVLVCF